MVDTDKPDFAKALQHFGTVHHVTVSKDFAREYWEALKVLSRPDFDVAVEYLKRHSQWMPKPASFFAASKRGWM
jgi:ABC-type taurine transport system substrate-binding protein